MNRMGDCSDFLTKYLRNRELGVKVKLGTTDKFMEKLYTHLLPCSAWDHNDCLRNSAPGGIFNLEFSPDGSLLVAACEKRSVLIFDPICRQLVNSIDNAHLDCVNCVRFLDSRVFATCSDDSTVALWDARNLKSSIRTLKGHSNWVKNIEYSQADGLLVTSGFDGVIYTWDINSYTEDGFLYDRVFHTNGLMRTRLNPDASKMIICTTGGFLMVIHDLNLRTLQQDLNGFKPNMYRLMQLSQTTIPVAASYTYLFSKKRKQNRIEFVSDFPEGDDAEVVSSLQVHPQGWCALSRNISNNETSEWTCVHDIQEVVKSNKRSHDSDSSDDEAPPLPPRGLTPPLSPPSSQPQSSEDRGERTRGRRGLQRQNAFRGLRGGSVSSPEVSLSSTDVWEALLAFREARRSTAHSQAQEEQQPPPNNAQNQNRRDLESRLMIIRMHSGLDNLVRPFMYRDRVSRVMRRSGVDRTTTWNPTAERERRHCRLTVPPNHKIHQNIPRLTHYIMESNVGKGFIKELCFSADGRLICSPFGYGVRLLTFSPGCRELCDCVPTDGPKPLHEVATNISHHDIVVSTKFSPTHCLLVSGCLTGRIVWHQPVL